LGYLVWQEFKGERHKQIGERARRLI